MSPVASAFLLAMLLLVAVIVITIAVQARHHCAEDAAKLARDTLQDIERLYAERQALSRSRPYGDVAEIMERNASRKDNA